MFTKSGLEDHKKGRESNLEKGRNKLQHAKDDVRGHPCCEFCDLHVFDGNELYRHMNAAHFSCFVCEKLDPHNYNKFYKNYDALNKHFREAHFICHQRKCLERRFIVFASSEEWRSHMRSEHPGFSHNLEEYLALNIAVGFYTHAYKKFTR